MREWASLQAFIKSCHPCNNIIKWNSKWTPPETLGLDHWETFIFFLNLSSTCLQWCIGPEKTNKINSGKQLYWNSCIKQTRENLTHEVMVERGIGKASSARKLFISHFLKIPAIPSFQSMVRQKSGSIPYLFWNSDLSSLLGEKGGDA